MRPNPAPRLLRAARLLGPTRLSVVLSTVSGGWLMTFLAFALESPATRNPALDRLGMGLSLLTVTGAMAGLSVCAVALNDVLDRRIDRTLRRHGPAGDRPVAEGLIDARTATAVALLSLLLGVASAAVLGPTSLRLAIGLGAGIVFYNFVGRFIPAVGIVGAALLHGLSLGLPNPHAGFAWPVLLTMTHLTACGLVRYRLEMRRPKLRGRQIWATLLGWAFCCLLVLTLIRSRPEPASTPSWIWLGPAAAAIGFVVFAGWRRRSAAAVGDGGAGFRRLSVWWLMVYDASWLAAAGLGWPAASIAGLLLSAAPLLLPAAPPTRQGRIISELTGR